MCRHFMVGNTQDEHSPVLVDALVNLGVSFIAAGGNHSVAADGSLLLESFEISFDFMLLCFSGWKCLDMGCWEARSARSWRYDAAAYSTTSSSHGGYQGPRTRMRLRLHGCSDRERPLRVGKRQSRSVADRRSARHAHCPYQDPS